MSPSETPIRIGDLLVLEGAITAAQLERALTFQGAQKLYRPIGEILVEQKFITRNHLNRLLNKHQKRIPLGELLINQGVITQDQLTEALGQQKKIGGKLGEILVKKGFLKESVLVDSLSLQLGILNMVPDFHLIDKKLLKGISEQFLNRNEIIPAFQEGDILTVIMSNPLDKHLVRDMSRFFRCTIRPAIASSTDIRKAIKQHFRRATLGEKHPEARKKDLIIGDRDLSLEEGDTVVGVVDYIITNAILEGASDIHIEPKEESIRVRYRVDGILRRKTDLPPSLALGLSSRIKVLCQLDIAEKRKHQDGRIRAQIMDKEVDLRVSVYASAFGENIVIRILYRKSELIDIDRLGITPQNKIKYMQLLEYPTGVVLVTGPTGSGKTTTLYASINHLNDGQTSIITVEDPVEYVIDGVVQGQLNPKLGHTYVDFIKSMMRQDPDVIMVGEIRDPTAAEGVIQAALTGHKVLTTFHTEDTTGALLRLMDMGIDTFLISSTVISVLAQRLLRVLCPKCKEAYSPDSFQLEALGVRVEKADAYCFYRAVGCPHCGNTGYRGRTGVHELLCVNDAVRDAILGRKTSGEIRRIARREADLVTMREDAFYKIVKGITSFEEVNRVIPFQQMDADFRRTPEEIVALAEGEAAAVDEISLAVQERARDGVAGSQEEADGDLSIGSGIQAEGYRIRFDTAGIEQEREKIAQLFRAYRRMMDSQGQALNTSDGMESFTEFIVSAVKRVESSFKSRFVEFAVSARDGRAELFLETMIPDRLTAPAQARAAKRSARLLDFLLSPSSQEIDLPAERKAEPARRVRSGLYKRHVERLEWWDPGS
ncbi:MAG: Flp pilus assembly complex ATPase component TadA [Deltaproteobacteria bacterium]|nr:Flp pilus assembly complex ATPase component TadA [Deltaproteobacteria bacterium]